METQDRLFILRYYTYETYRRRYPKYSIYKGQEVYCHSLEDAEAMMRRCLEPEKEFWFPNNVHHFEISEYAFNQLCWCHYWCHHYITSRIYDANGELIDQSLCQGFAENGEFHGRPKEMIRFAPGDIVEVMNGDEIELAFVVNTPIDPYQAERINSRRPILDDTDDSYTALTTNDYRSNSHPHSLAVFKPLFPIPAPTLNRLKRAYEQFVEKENK